jgi:hypothetical protein
VGKKVYSAVKKSDVANILSEYSKVEGYQGEPSIPGENSSK